MRLSRTRFPPVGIPDVVAGLVLVLLLPVMTTTAAVPGALRAGVARAEITPPPGKYEVIASKKIGVSARDPLYAKALVLENGRTRLAVVSLDLVGPLPPELFDPYREKLKREARMDYVVLNASHTHSSPETEARAEELQSLPWVRETLGKIYRTVLAAHHNAVPVRIGLGHGQASIGANRRLVTPSGVRMLSRTYPGKSLNEPTDRRVGVLRLDRRDGTTLALVVHYACHPVTLMAADTTQFSADYVGEMAKEVSARAPGHPEVLFWQGAAGDINLRDSIQGSGEPEVLRYGRELANAVLEAASKIQTSEESGLSYGFEILSVPSRWSSDIVPELRKKDGAIYRWFERNYMPVYSAPVATMLVGRKLAVAFLPGEPFIDFQFKLDQNSPVANSWLVGYCERGFGYLPTIRAASEGGYGAGGPESLLEVGAGEHLLARALVQIYRQLGRLGSMPGELPQSPPSGK